MTQRLVWMDADAAHAREAVRLLQAAGLEAQSVHGPGDLKPALRVAPALIVLNEEPSSLEVAEVLELLNEDAALARIPVVLVARDLGDAPLIRNLRAGVVEVLARPFAPEHHIPQLKHLLQALSQRSGEASGKGPRAMLQNIRRVRRSGALQVAGPNGSQSTALFVKGALRSARHWELQGEQAVDAMEAEVKASWTFTELGGQDGDGPGVIVELEALPDLPPVAPSENPPTRLRVLLVDDDPELCRMFQLLFERRGFSVVTAQDGIEGVDKAFAEPFDLVVADLNMPRMDGWGLLRRLRDDFRTRELPVAMLSCQDDYRESLKALDAGAQAYLPKTTRLDPLVQQLRSLLEPRTRLEAQVRVGMLSQIPIGGVGLQWTLRMLASAKATGTLRADEGYASYELHFREGVLVHAFALQGDYKAGSERALLAFLAARASTATWDVERVAPGKTLNKPMETLLKDATDYLNVRQQRMRDALLVTSESIQVHPELYRIYQQNGPAAARETARLLCEEKLSPREVMARSDASSLDVEETFRDLVRRGVVELQPSPP